MTEGEHCPACGGEAQELGVLGSARHFRCQNCSAMFWQKLTTKRLEHVQKHKASKKTGAP